MPPSAPDNTLTPTPFTSERIARWMADCDLPFFISSDQNIGTILHHRVFSFVLVGETGTILRIQGTWNRELAIERIGEILEICNDWNGGYSGSKAYICVPDHGNIQVRVETAIDLAPGMSAHQLDRTLHWGIDHGMTFFDILDQHYPDPARQAI